MRAIATRGPTRSSDGDVHPPHALPRLRPRQRPPRPPRRALRRPSKNPHRRRAPTSPSRSRTSTAARESPSRFPASTLTVHKDSKDGEELGTQTTDQTGPRQHRASRATARTSSSSTPRPSPTGVKLSGKGETTKTVHGSSSAAATSCSSRSARSWSKAGRSASKARRRPHRRHQVRPDHRARRAGPVADLRHDRSDELLPRRADHLRRDRRPTSSTAASGCR